MEEEMISTSSLAAGSPVEGRGYGRRCTWEETRHRLPHTQGIEIGSVSFLNLSSFYRYSYILIIYR
jgi:hypothetical protein